MTEENNSKPVFKVSYGAIEVAVWENDSQNNGKFYSITSHRNYVVKENDQDVWKKTNTLREGDVLNQMLALEEAYKFCKTKKE